MMAKIKVESNSNKLKLVLAVVLPIILITLILSFILVSLDKKQTSNAQANMETKINDLYDVITEKNNIINNLNAQLNECKADVEILNNTIKINEATISELKSYKFELETQNNSLKELKTANEKTIASNDAKILQLEAEIRELTASNTEYENTINSLNTQIQLLQNEKSENEETINENNLKISELISQVNSLTSVKTANETTIADKNKQIENLNTSIGQLQAINEINTNTINSLSSQISILNARISSISLQLQENINSLSSLTAKVNNLENSVKYYELFISNLETEDKCVATFEFNDSVYNIQFVSKGSKLSITNPTNTDRVIFNFWKTGDTAVDFDAFIINSNTKFIADITVKYLVKFVVDDDTTSEYVVKGQIPSLNNTPTKEGYRFDGWTKNGNDIVDVDNTPITNDTIYIAKFTKVYTVSFTSDDDTIDTQLVDSGTFATLPTNPPVKEGYRLAGYSLNSTDIIDVTTVPILEDTTFIAVFVQQYTITVMSQQYVGEVIYTKQVDANSVCGDLGFNAPDKEHYEFSAWHKVNGLWDTEVDFSSYVVTGNLTIYPMYTQVEFAQYFYSQDELIDTIWVGKNKPFDRTPTIPSIPEGYIFTGWVYDDYNRTYDDHITSDNLIGTYVTKARSYYAGFTSKQAGEFKYVDSNGNIQYISISCGNNYSNENNIQIQFDYQVTSSNVYTRYLNDTYLTSDDKLEINTNFGKTKLSFSYYCGGNVRITYTYNELTDIWSATWANKNENGEFIDSSSTYEYVRYAVITGVGKYVSSVL